MVEHLTFNQVVAGSTPACLRLMNPHELVRGDFAIFICGSRTRLRNGNGRRGFGLRSTSVGAKRRSTGSSAPRVSQTYESPQISSWGFCYVYMRKSNPLTKWHQKALLPICHIDRYIYYKKHLTTTHKDGNIITR